MPRKPHITPIDNFYLGYPPKAGVASSNLAGRANLFRVLTGHMVYILFRTHG